jgi:hypothetical protein
MITMTPSEFETLVIGSGWSTPKAEVIGRRAAGVWIEGEARTITAHKMGISVVSYVVFRMNVAGVCEQELVRGVELIGCRVVDGERELLGTDLYALLAGAERRNQLLATRLPLRDMVAVDDVLNVTALDVVRDCDVFGDALRYIAEAASVCAGRPVSEFEVEQALTYDWGTGNDAARSMYESGGVYRIPDQEIGAYVAEYLRYSATAESTD